MRRRQFLSSLAAAASTLAFNLGLLGSRVPEPRLSLAEGDWIEVPIEGLPGWTAQFQVPVSMVRAWLLKRRDGYLEFSHVPPATDSARMTFQVDTHDTDKVADGIRIQIAFDPKV